jgi:hypothetical protein
VWWPESTTFGWMTTSVPPSAVRIESSSMSKPSALSRSTRSLMRHRSAVENCSRPISSFQSIRYWDTIRSLVTSGSRSSST